MASVVPSARPRLGLALLAALLAVSGCANQADLKPAICDGRHRRPANPYGSVIATPPDATGPLATPPPTPASGMPASATPAAPAPASVTPKPQARLDLRSFSPCGARS